MRVYNAIMLASTAIRRAHAHGAPLDGYTVASYAQNVTFSGLFSAVTTDQRAEVILEFNLWDYRPDSSKYELVLGLSSDLSKTVELGTILWPGGVELAGDECVFEECAAGK